MKAPVSEQVNAVFDYVKKHMQTKATKKDEQDATRQRKLNNFESLMVNDSDDKLERQLAALEETA